MGRLYNAASSVAVPLAINVTSQAANASWDWPRTMCSDEAMPDSWAMRRNSSSCEGTAGTTILIAGSAFRTKAAA